MRSEIFGFRHAHTVVVIVVIISKTFRTKQTQTAVIHSLGLLITILHQPHTDIIFIGDSSLDSYSKNNLTILLIINRSCRDSDSGWS